jgi:hypothetical protein
VLSRNISGANACGVWPGVGEEVPRPGLVAIFPGDAAPYDAGDVPKVLPLFGIDVISQRFLRLPSCHDAS